MRALIIGGAGFIGGALANRIAALGHDIDIVDNLSRGQLDDHLKKLLDFENVRLLEHTVEDLTADKLPTLGYTHVFHFAAILGVDNVTQRPFDTLSSNIYSLQAAVKLAGAMPNLERFVFLSTSEIYAASVDNSAAPIPTPEDARLILPDISEPRSTYMLSKIIGETLVQHSGLRFTIFRPHNIYGPRMGSAHVIPQLLEKAFSAEPGDFLDVYSVDHTRSFCYIDDAIDLLYSGSVSANTLNSTYNLGDQSHEITIGDLARLITSLVNKELFISPLPATAGSASRRCPDMQKLRLAIGLQAQTPLGEGVSKTYEWYRSFVFQVNSDE